MLLNNTTSLSHRTNDPPNHEVCGQFEDLGLDHSLNSRTAIAIENITRKMENETKLLTSDRPNPNIWGLLQLHTAQLHTFIPSCHQLLITIFHSSST